MKPGPMDPMTPTEVWAQAEGATTDQDKLDYIVKPLQNKLAAAEERIRELEIELRAERMFGNRMFDKVMNFARTALM